MNNLKEERTILAFKLQPKMNPDQGDIRPIAEIVDGDLVELNYSNFCHTNKVFVTTGYQLIDEKFKEGRIFRITVTQADYISTNIDPSAASRYLTQGIKAERLKPSELIEVMEAELPDRNYRYLENGLTPTTEYIFLKNNAEECFGLFAWERKDGDLGFNLELLNDTPLLKSYKLLLGQLLRVKTDKPNPHLFTCFVEDREYHFVLNINDFLSEHDYYDYASDEEIVRYCAKLAGEIGATLFKKAEWDNFRKLASTHIKFNQGVNKNRLAQLSKLAIDIPTDQDEIRNNIELFLRGENGEQLILDFINRKRPQLVESLRKEILLKKDDDIKEKEKLFSQIDLRTKEKERELNELSADVERKRKEASQDAILEKAVAERNEKMQALEKQITDKEEKLNEIIEKHNLACQLDSIKTEVQLQEKIYYNQLKKNDSLESTTKKLQNEYNTAEDDLRAKLILYKPYVEAINGSFISENREKKSVCVKTNTMIDSVDSFEQQRLIIETVKHNLLLKGRSFESWQIANLLISTQQSFITFLAGLPGVGKTSLARLIAEAQQLSPRLQEVSVARGWTSQKDLIGFYNPLSNRFQSSNTGLYAFIEALNMEKNDPAMAYVLLDEANLSPIEHYWSAFMAMTDGDGERILRLGQETLIVPTFLRFLATINYDGTTEPLSPRVVDRAPVLVIEPILLEENETLSDEKRIDLPLSALEMNNLFGLAENVPPFADGEAAIFDRIRLILANPSLEKGRPLSISPRKEIVIRQYCKQASSLMRFFGCDDFKALDLAVLQHVLPQVRGSGYKFANRLKELKQTCYDEGLKDSDQYLEKMLAYGETELHSYDFFCW